MELGKNIAALRRERGLTQEQLGQMLNISGQAVSKWENGGTPDAEILPSIADRLGVTIDTLYGRSHQPAEDMVQTLFHWLAAFPAEQRMDALFRLLCSTFQRPYYVDDEALLKMMEAVVQLPIKSCYSTDVIHHTKEQLWLRSELALPTGLQLGVLAEDCPMFLLLPEPEGGYGANLADNEQYRALFAALALPGALELLRFLYGREKSTAYSAEAISKASGVAMEDVKAALTAMLKCNLVSQSTVELTSGTTEIYTLHSRNAFVPFLLLARWISDKTDSYFCQWENRTAPILKEEGKEYEEQ